MMKFDVLTLFPEMYTQTLGESIIGNAIKNQIISLNLINIRDFSQDKHNRVDDYPYGGGAGMVMGPQPIYDAYNSIASQLNYKPRVIYLTPQGKTFNHNTALELSKENHLVFLCGHYEGVDERVIEGIVTDEISIGDYVLTGGELASMVLIDAISRLLPGVLAETSASDESFYNGLLEYPQYTRPYEFMDKRVPDVLLSGHHENIRKWRLEQSIIRTLAKRPDLLENYNFNKEELSIIKKLVKN